MRYSVLAISGFLPAIAFAQQSSSAAARHAFTPADWYKVTTLSAPALTPDGKSAAFTVTTVKEAENRRHAEIWMVPLAGGEPVRLTTPGTESSAPRFSDDGKIMYFTSTRPGGRGAQWAIHMDAPGEAYQPAGPMPQQGVQPADRSFTIYAEGAGGGRGGGRGGRGGGVFVEQQGDTMTTASESADPYAKMPVMARPPYGSITKPENPARFDGMEILDMRFKANGQGYVPSSRTAPRPPQVRASQIYIQRPGQSRVQLTDTKYSHRDVAVSPDGKWLAFVADARLRPDSVVTAERDSIAKLAPDRKRDEMDRNETELFVLPVAACESKSPECTPKKIEYAGNESDVVWSPDSKQLAFVGRPSRYKNARLFTVAANGGKPQDILGSWKYEPGQIHWLRDGQIAMITSQGGRSGLFAIDPQTKKITTVIGGRRMVSSVVLDTAQTHWVYVSTDLTHPTEIFVANLDGSGERMLTSFNDKVNAEVAWADADEFMYKSDLGMDIEGWLMKPDGYDPAKKYPVVLYIHGGPHSAYGENWFDEFQNLAGAGFFVLFTNPRGSSGTNSEFTYASRGDWGGRDYNDIMKAVDIVSKRPDVDSTRMGVTGGSYGGFMTAWVTTKTNRFKAAETDRMISEWTFWYGASDAQGLTEEEFFGKPWENQIMYDTLSPIRHVKNVKTPTLLVQSEEDFRTPIGNAELWFEALKKQGVPAEFVRYPRSNHDLSRTGEPWLLVDRLSRLRQWFGYWLKEKPTAAATESK